MQVFESITRILRQTRSPKPAPATSGPTPLTAAELKMVAGGLPRVPTTPKAIRPSSVLPSVD